MYITKAISINGGWDNLSKNDNALADLNTIASCFTHAALLEENVSNTNKLLSETLISPVAFNRLFRKVTSQLRWRQRSSEVQGTLVPRFIIAKHDVSLEATFGSIPAQVQNVDRWALVNSVREQESQISKLSVLFVLEKRPDWYAHRLNKAGDKNRNFYAEILSHLEEQVLPLYHNLPLVVLAINEEYSPLETLELANLTQAQSVEQVMEFTPENYQAGVGILSYFSEILKNKYPDMDAKVRIEQEGYTVRMTVETQDGNQEIIEEALNTYQQVVVKEKPPESLLDDKIQISELTMQLTMIEAQLEHKQQLLQISNDRYKTDVTETRNEVAFLRQCIKEQMQLTQGSQVLIGKQIEKDEKVTLAQLACQERTIEALLEQSSHNKELNNALSYISSLLEGQVTKQDEATSKIALETIRKESPSVFNELSELLRNSMYGVGGNIVFGWMTEISNIIA